MVGTFDLGRVPAVVGPGHRGSRQQSIEMTMGWVCHRGRHDHPRFRNLGV